MMKKTFFKMLFTFILIFSLVASTVFSVLIFTSGGTFFGYEFSSASEQSYVNALLLGVDKDGYRTDVIILAQLNLADGEINMLQIPRDTYVDSGRADHKINSAYGYNKEKQVLKEVSELLGVKVEKSILIDTKGFRDLIDTIGGVDFDVPINMNYDDPEQDLHIHLEKGLQHLDGSKAEQFVRFRQNNDGSGYALGDIQRLQAQSLFIQATIDELFSLVNVFKINDLVKDFSTFVKTNFTLNEMLTYAPYVFSIDREKIYTHQLHGEGKYIGPVSYFVSDDAANEKLIEEHFTPSSETITRSELEIQKTVIGVSSEKVSTLGIKPKTAFANRFVSVDIIDATNGEADISEIKQNLKKYGFSIKNVTGTKDSTYPETTVVSKTKTPRAECVAAVMGLEQYIYNGKKETGSDITIIVGKNWEK